MLLDCICEGETLIEGVPVMLDVCEKLRDGDCEPVGEELGETDCVCDKLRLGLCVKESVWVIVELTVKVAVTDCDAL